MTKLLARQHLLLLSLPFYHHHHQHHHYHHHQHHHNNITTTNIVIIAAIIIIMAIINTIDNISIGKATSAPTLTTSSPYLMTLALAASHLG